MAGIFQNGVWSMGFDMDPTAAQIFTQATAGIGSTAQTRSSFGYSWQTGGGTCGILLNTNLTSIIDGIGLYAGGSLPSTAIVKTWYDATAGAIQVALRVNSTGQLQFFLGAGTGTPIGSASTAGTILPNTWYYLECTVVISATVGFVECKVNGITAITTAATQNTKSTANAFMNAVQIVGPTNPCYFDDWYMLDTTGSSPLNTYLGPVQVRGDAPNNNSAVGGRNAYTPTNPTNVNHSNVANIPANTSEYNADSTPGDYDMFRFPALPGSVATVLFTNLWVLTELDTSGARTVKLDTYSNGTDSATAAFSPPTGTPTYYNQVSTVDPHTIAAWTVANAGALEGGIKTQS